MNVLIYGQVYKPNHRECLLDVLKAMEREGITPLAAGEYWAQADPEIMDYQGVTIFKDFRSTPVDVVMAFGGDGTVLGAIALVNEHQIPVMGINLGRLGFLSSIEGKVAGFAVTELAQGRYHYDERSMISLETDADIFLGSRVALNDFTLHKRDTSSMITIHTYINGELLHSYWADGLIVATPTGSTGYSLSCGGPIVFPETGSFVITPVAPHNLNVRPIIVPDRSVISFEVEGRSNNFLVSLDSRSRIVETGVQLAVRRENFNARLVKINQVNFLSTLRNKLNWGLDKRNE